MGEGTVIDAAPPGQRYIIERPRLTRRLDETTARVILLLAPAGYGKTTLARQWLADPERRAVWVRATPASEDVAALAAEIAAALEEVQHGLTRLVSTRLTAAKSPNDDAPLLARVLADAMADSPDDVWLAIDDYHFVASGAADAFVATLASESSLRLLLATRTRPHWASARRVLYQEVATIGMDDLAFTAAEARNLLRGLAPRRAAAVLERARGWPAVVRLAALSEVALPSVVEGTALYDYFAEELFQTAPPHVQEGLLRLTPFPTLTNEVIAEVLGDSASIVSHEAVGRGFLSRYDGSYYELHPLLREFLETKFGQLPQANELVIDAFSRILQWQTWDDGYAVITRFDRPELLDELLANALAGMLSTNRIATLQDWVTTATASGFGSPVIDVASGEVDLRLGNLERGATRALQAIRSLPAASPLLSRAYAVASICAHFLGRADDALTWGRQAEEAAVTTFDAQRAVWTQLTAAVDFEVEDPATILARFEEVADASVDAAIRVLTGKLLTAMARGSVSAAFDEARAQFSLVDQSTDIFAATALTYRIAYSGLLAGRYFESLPIARRAVRDITSGDLGFAYAHAMGTMVGIMIGLRRFRRASRLLDRLSEELRIRPNAIAQANWHALKARLLLSTNAPSLAASEASVALSTAPTTAMRGELSGLLALALAASDSPDGALEPADEASSVTRDVQGVTLSRLARAIRSVKTRSQSADGDLAAAESALLEKENFDSLVYGIRAYPPLLVHLRRREVIPEALLARVARNARDEAIAATVGWRIDPQRLPQPLLTAREVEVFELMRQGWTNREIASALFITEATVKVHVRHILEKFGARSRTEAVVRFGRY